MYKLHMSSIAAGFPPPKLLSMPAAGIDVSDTSIKYLDAEYSSGGLIPRTFDSVRLEKGIVVDGVVKQREALAKALGELRGKHKRHFVNASLPEELAYLYTFEIPNEGGYDGMLQAVEFSLGEHVPIAIEDAVFNFDVLSEREDTSDVSVVVFPREVIEGYKEAFEKGGFSVKRLELEAHSVARAIIPQDDEGVSMIIDFGRTRTGITITQGQIPIFSTTVKVGGAALTEAIMEKRNVNEEEADVIKRTQGIVACEDKELCAILIKSTDTLIDEIRRHHRFWDTRRDEAGNRIAAINRIYLCGGAVGLKGLPEHVARVLQVPVRVGDVWQNLFSFEHHIPRIGRIFSWQYATAAGLLLEK